MCLLLVLFCFTEHYVYMSVIFCLVFVPPPLSIMHKVGNVNSCFTLLSWMCYSLLFKFCTDYLHIKFWSEKELNGAIFQNIKPYIFTSAF